MSASLSREASYSAIRFGIYDLCKDSLLGLPILGGENGILGGKDGFGVKLGGGLMSGMIGSSIANPADLVSFPSSMTSSPSEIFPNSRYFVPDASVVESKNASSRSSRNSKKSRYRNLRSRWNKRFIQSCRTNYVTCWFINSFPIGCL